LGGGSDGKTEKMELERKQKAKNETFTD